MEEETKDFISGEILVDVLVQRIVLHHQLKSSLEDFAQNNRIKLLVCV